MKRVIFESSWPDSWKYYYRYDLQEIYGEVINRGYTYAYANRFRHAIELVQKIAKPEAKILDIAAGQGNFSLTLAELGYEVTWNDINDELMDYVKAKHERGVIHFAPGNVFTLDFKNQFDVVLATEIIEHVAHPDDFLRFIACFIKQGGYIVMTTPNGEYFRYGGRRFTACKDPSKFEHIQFGPNSDSHIFLLYLDEVSGLAQKAGLSVIETRLFTNPLTNGHIKLEMLLKIIPSRWADSFEKFTYSLPVLLKRKICNTIAILFRR